MFFTRKLLEQWLKSHGKSYKRPPLTLPAAKPRRKKESLNQSFWSSLGEEEEMADRSWMNKILSTLTECLKLAEEVSFGSFIRHMDLGSCMDVNWGCYLYVCK